MMKISNPSEDKISEKQKQLGLSNPSWVIKLGSRHLALRQQSGFFSGSHINVTSIIAQWKRQSKHFLKTKIPGER
jgi:hypothetical protein